MYTHCQALHFERIIYVWADKGSTAFSNVQTVSNGSKLSKQTGIQQYNTLGTQCANKRTETRPDKYIVIKSGSVGILSSYVPHIILDFSLKPHRSISHTYTPIAKHICIPSCVTYKTLKSEWVYVLAVGFKFCRFGLRKMVDVTNSTWIKFQCQW